MASSYSSSSSMMFILVVILLPIFSFLQHFSMASFDFQVGGTIGWIVPPPNDTNIYNDWASNNRFKVGDTIYFRYKKDSVMEVSEEDYKECNATHPRFFSNNGETVFRLEHSGSFYFISGAAGHCEKGQKMIVRVMVQEYANSSGYHHAITTPYAVFGMFFFHFLFQCFSSFVI